MSRRGGQGEALVTWAVWMVLLVIVVVTYTRLPVFQLYRVSNDGIAGGLGRGVVLSNYPIAIAASALVLIAADSLPRVAWWVAGPALVLCATIGFTVDPHDLDFRLVNLLAALGVLLAIGLTIAAVRRVGTSFVSRLPGDRVRVVVAVVVLVFSLPWMAADLGTHLPEGVFLTSKIVTMDGPPARPGPVTGRDDPGEVRWISGSETLSVVHVGHHHGFDCALLFLTALLLSRTRPVGRRVGVALTACLGLMASYGLVNATEDFWHEQVVKRGWSSLKIPSAQIPSASGVWLVIVLLGVVGTLVFAYERRVEERAEAPATTTPASPAHR
jgi:hypothetical protein